mmetsp:Transcript_7099/g.26577  ORF Transcript_7099/g.26577 Transcript_7099/m.26577 type:complete len:513 (-) Transcript_7099:314-1852(-)|eukprot:CAMPEP_0117450188 /NCGR_PEP_ID=MMETSP0759-20121206/8335_1 /TAXON_ID=63605 /ORGANISM="Percolomonas cosmopolitus, Strain WS" /LENGTH=512 /DNA_ID=CAMNT_0005242693 /DNA_START=149 /DNA_END=1690 /DNA_ORIENTATION=+
MPTFELYDILEIASDATEKQIKRAYRQQAMKWHPDLHPDDKKDEATVRFKEISNAYTVLSDPHERRWYDEHGDEDTLNDQQEWNEEPNDFISDLKQYMRSSIFQGYEDDAKGFYRVFNDLFIKLETQETMYCSLREKGKVQRMPRFGDSSTPYDSVKRFYREWKYFHTLVSFGWKDKWRLDKNDPQYNSYVRRQVEKENRAERSQAKIQFNGSVRALVQWLKQRDRRILLEEERQRKEQKRLKREKERQAKIDAELLKEIKANEVKDFGEGVENLDDDIQDDLMAYFDDKKSKKKNKKKKGRKAQMDFDEYDYLDDDLSNNENESAKHDDLDGTDSDEDNNSITPHDDEDSAKSESESQSHEPTEEELLIEAELELSSMQGRKKKKKRSKNKFMAPPPTFHEEEVHAEKDDDSEIIMNTQRKSKKSRRSKKNAPAPLIPDEASKPNSKADDATSEDADTQDLSKQEAKRLKRQQRKEKKSKSSTSCKKCGASFSSRSKLFEHLKSTGHAALK